MLLLLGAPILAAIFALLFFAYRPSDPVPRRFHALCRRRREVTRLLFEAGGRSTAVLRSAVMQALGVGVSLWPFRHSIDPVFGIPVALGAILAALGSYLLLARIFYAMLRTSMQKLETVSQWLEIGRGASASAGLVRLKQDVFGFYFHAPEPELARRGRLVYGLAFVSSAQRGWLEETFFSGKDDVTGERIAVLATIEEPRALCMSALHDLWSLAADTGATLFALSSSTARIVNQELIESIRNLRKHGIEILLLDEADLSEAIAAKALAGKPRAPMQRARARALHLLNLNDEKLIAEEPNRANWLASRALASLKGVIRTLPKSSIVFDLGSGYGRHTLFAAIAGHQVLAVERNAAACEHLKDNLRALPAENGKVQILHGDFRELPLKSSGLADLVICTGVLQHARDLNDLTARLSHISNLAGQPAAMVYLEMLFEMLFDGQPPADGRIRITSAEFENLLEQVFPPGSWSIFRTYGPMRQTQSFDGGRSFEPPARSIESTSSEYLIRRLD